MRRAAVLTILLVGASGWVPVQSEELPVELRTVDGREAVAITGCDPEELRRLEATSTDWGEILSVRTGPSTVAVWGSHRIAADTLLFVPRFPIKIGYGVYFDGGQRLSCGGREKFSLWMHAAADTESSSTSVVRVEPGLDRLPENLLKFYLHFSAPMSRGYAYRHVQLLGEDGRPIELPFLEIDQELWDPDGKRLTLLFDPGRVKRELLPNREVGPPLVAGRRYVLRVEKDWPDAEGRPLTSTFDKTFEVGPADRQSPDPAEWRLTVPIDGSTQPLMITFDEPLDGGLARRQIGVIGPGGRALAGTIELRENQLRWLFQPEEPWQAGRHELLIGTTLEDLAGNSVGRTFEVDLFEKVEARVSNETLSLAFEIRPGSH